MERRSIHRGVFSSFKELRGEIRRYIKNHNQELAKPFKWTKSATAIIVSVERARQQLNDITNRTRH